MIVLVFQSFLAVSSTCMPVCSCISTVNCMTVAQSVYLCSLHMIANYHFLHVSSPKRICQLYILLLAPFTSLYEYLNKGCTEAV